MKHLKKSSRLDGLLPHPTKSMPNGKETMLLVNVEIVVGDSIS